MSFKFTKFYLTMTLIGGKWTTVEYVFMQNGFDLRTLASEFETAKTFTGVVKVEAYAHVEDSDDTFVIHEWRRDQGPSVDAIYMPCVYRKDCDGFTPT